MLAITSLILRPKTPTFRYEVLIPYTDPKEAYQRGLPLGARLSMIVEVWAPSSEKAQQCALERFRDHRAVARSARIEKEGPIPLRVVKE